METKISQSSFYFGAKMGHYISLTRCNRNFISFRPIYFLFGVFRLENCERSGLWRLHPPVRILQPRMSATRVKLTAIIV